MIIYLLNEAEICGDVWSAGTKLEAPKKAAVKAIADGVATSEPPAKEEPKPEPAKKKVAKKKTAAKKVAKSDD